MSEKADPFERLARRGLALYCAGAMDGSYESVMDELGQIATDEQWEMLTGWLDEADSDIGDTDAATLKQKEDSAARRQQRPSRYPSMLALYAMDPAAHEILRSLETEYGIEAPDYGQKAGVVARRQRAGG